jgi:hypothetical protein
VKDICVAVVTGGHSYEVREFRDLFDRFGGTRCYVQHLEDFCSSSDETRDSYNAVVFYFMPDGQPDNAGPGYRGRQEAALKRVLSGSGQGILLLHHSILAYENWEPWIRLVDIGDWTLDYRHDQQMRIMVEKTKHPITEGLQEFTTTDETYLMPGPSPESEVLLTTDHPQSMREIAWARRNGESRVFCFQLGHDPKGWQNPGFMTVLERGIGWVSRSL